MKSPDSLLKYLTRKKIAILEELKKLLKTHSRTTVFRKLKTLDYISSYSHKGKYYSLNTIAEYNDYGVWQYNSVMFSKYGTVKKTLEFLIESSSKGYAASELYLILGVKVEDVLLNLLKSKQLIRKRMSGKYVYFSKTLTRARNRN